MRNTFHLRNPNANAYNMKKNSLNYWHDTVGYESVRLILQNYNKESMFQNSTTLVFRHNRRLSFINYCGFRLLRYRSSKNKRKILENSLRCVFEIQGIFIMAVYKTDTVPT